VRTTSAKIFQTSDCHEIVMNGFQVSFDEAVSLCCGKTSQFIYLTVKFLFITAKRSVEEKTFRSQLFNFSFKSRKSCKLTKQDASITRPNWSFMASLLPLWLRSSL